MPVKETVLSGKGGYKLYVPLRYKPAAELHQKNDSYGMTELCQDAGEAGEVVKVARKEAEKRLGRPAVTKELPNTGENILIDQQREE